MAKLRPVNPPAVAQSSAAVHQKCGPRLWLIRARIVAERVEGMEAEGNVVGWAGCGTAGLAASLGAAGLVAGHALVGWKV